MANISANTGILGLFYVLNDRGRSLLLFKSKDDKDRSVCSEIYRFKDRLIRLFISGFSYYSIHRVDYYILLLFLNRECHIKYNSMLAITEYIRMSEKMNEEDV